MKLIESNEGRNTSSGSLTRAGDIGLAGEVIGAGTGWTEGGM